MKLVKIRGLYLFVLKSQYSSKLSCHKSQSKAEELFQIKGGYSDMTRRCNTRLLMDLILQGEKLL